MRRMRADCQAAIGLFVILIVALIIVAILAAVVFVPWQTASVDESRHVAKAAGFEQMAVSITSMTGAIEVSFGDLASDFAQLTVKGTGRMNLLTNNPLVTVNLTSSSSTDGKTLSIQGLVSMGTLGSTFQFSNLTIKMVLDRSIPSHVNVLSDTGRISLAAGQGTMLEGASLQTTAGAIAVTLGEGTNLTGNLSMVSTLGAVKLNWHDVEAKEETHVTLGTTTGSIVTNITQHANMKGNVTFSSIATVGSITLAVDIADGNAARVESASGFDNVNVQKKVGFTGTNDLLSSTNYPDAQPHRFDIVLSVNTGTINLSLGYETP